MKVLPLKSSMNDWYSGDPTLDPDRGLGHKPLEQPVISHVVEHPRIPLVGNPEFEEGLFQTSWSGQRHGDGLEGTLLRLGGLIIGPDRGRPDASEALCRAFGGPLWDPRSRV